jgi:PAS domain S-box-containing protein
VKGPDGVVQGIVVAVHDATSLKRAEQEARARLEELESLYRNAPVGLCLIDRDLRFVRVNEQVARFNGIPASAHAGRPLEEVVPSAGQWALQAVARVLETGEPARDLEMRGDPRLPPEEQRRLRVDLEPATSEDGSVTGVIGVVHDVTALRQAEEEAHRLTELARARLEELEAVYALAPVGLMLLDRQLRFVRVNERIAALTGRSASEHVGRPLSALPAELADQLQPVLDSVLATGSPVYDQRVATSEGSWLVNHVPVMAPDGSVGGILTAFRDVTEA